LIQTRFNGNRTKKLRDVPPNTLVKLDESSRIFIVREFVGYSTKYWGSEQTGSTTLREVIEVHTGKSFRVENETYVYIGKETQEEKVLSIPFLI